MPGIIGTAFDIRPGERSITFLMMLYHFLVLITLYLLKPARDSLFLVKLGADQLPFVFMLIALVGLPITILYARASRQVSLDRLINGTTAVLIICLFILRGLVHLEYTWVYYLFYVWVSIYGILTVSQFWLLANAVYNAAQAKRMFALLGLGGIAGAIVGGAVTSLLVKTIGISTADLLLLSAVLLAGCIYLANTIWTRRPLDGSPRLRRNSPFGEINQSYGTALRTVGRSRYLKLLVGIIALTTLASSFIDFQFKTVSAAAFPAETELTAFLGKFYSGLCVLAVALQLVFTQRFLKFFGVGWVIMLLPLSLLVGSLGLMIVPGLLLVTIVRGVEGGLSYSSDKTGRELLYLPVPMEVKKRTKVFIDMLVDRWFQGIAGGLLVLFTLVFHMTVRHLSLVVIGFVGVWLVLAWLARREYVAAFRAALKRREIDLDDINMNIAEADTLNTLINSLESDNEREVVYALDLLAPVGDARVLTQMKKLLGHSSAEIRARALPVLHHGRGEVSLDEISGLVDDPHPDVRRAAVHYLTHRFNRDSVAVLSEYLHSDDPLVRIAAVDCVAEYGSDGERALVDRDLVDSLMSVTGSSAALGRETLARFIGGSRRSEFYGRLRALLGDGNEAVVRSAILSAGRTGSRDFLPLLVQKLADSNHRSAAIEALASYGSAILGSLRDCLLDRSVALIIRQSIPRVIGRMEDQQAVDTLCRVLSQVETGLRFSVVRALSKLRARFERLRFSRPVVMASLLEETRDYYRCHQILHRTRARQPTPPDRLLEKTLEEKLDRNLQRIFRLLGLCYPPGDMYSAYQGITHNSTSQRASAIEFLDNLLRADEKKYLFPILDDLPLESTIRHGRELFGLSIGSRVDALGQLIAGDDSWLKTCAIYAGSSEKSPELRRSIEKARDDSDPIVQETCRLVLGRQG